MSQTRRVFVASLSLLFIFGSLLAVSSDAAAASPRTRLEAAVTKAIRVLQDPAWAAPGKAEARREKLRRIIYKEFDFNRMSRGAVGRKWRKFSSAQRSRFVTLFRRLLENTYMGTIERYKGETVEFLKEVKQSKTVARVDSLVRSRGQKYKIAYRLRHGSGGWKVFDVIIEGVSVVSNYRAQFKQMLRKGGSKAIESLLTKLQQKVNQTARTG